MTPSPAARRPVLDHVAVGTHSLADGWALFAGMLGGRWAYGGDSPGYWWGQLKFASGAKVELLTPTGGPDAAFLERFLVSRGPGQHHFNFIVPDITETLEQVRAIGIEPVQVNLDNPNWKEAFLHPKSAFGIVVQVAQQGMEPDTPPPAGLPDPAPAAEFVVAEHYVDDLDAALRLFRGALAGEVVAREPKSSGEAVLLRWANGAQLRLMRPSSAAERDALVFGGAAHHLEFARVDGSFTAGEVEAIGSAASRLGVSVHLV